METHKKKTFLINFLFIAVWSLIIYITFRFMLSYLFPFIIGLIISFLVQKPSELLSKKIKIKKGTCAAILSAFSFILFFIILGLIVWFLVSQLNSLIEFLSSKHVFFTEIIEKTNLIINRFSNAFSGSMQKTIDNIISVTFGQFSDKFSVFLSQLITSVIKNMPTIFISCIVTVVATFYIAKDFDFLKKFLKNLLKINTYNNIVKIKNIFFGCILKFLLGYSLIISITFSELLIAFYFLGVKHFFALSFLISIIDILPIIGTGTVLIPWAFFSFMGGKFTFGVSLIILYVLVTVLRNFLEPKIISKQIGINPLFTLIAIFIGYKLAGAVGMLMLPISMIAVITFYKEQLNTEKALVSN